MRLFKTNKSMNTDHNGTMTITLCSAKTEDKRHGGDKALCRVFVFNFLRY